MKIAVIGAGSVGGTLGSRWAQAGHEVVFGVRHPDSEKTKEVLTASGPNGSAASPAEAAARADVLLLATPWNATEEILRSLGDLTGKVILDATNPLQPGLSGLTDEPAGSAGQQVAAWATGAKVVKAFNTTGYDNMADPAYPEGPATLLYCGDDPDAKAIAHQLSADLGFDPVDAGPLTRSAQLEHLALLWISMAYSGMGRDIAFRLMRR